MISLLQLFEYNDQLLQCAKQLIAAFLKAACNEEHGFADKYRAVVLVLVPQYFVYLFKMHVNAVAFHCSTWELYQTLRKILMQEIEQFYFRCWTRKEYVIMLL